MKLKPVRPLPSPRILEKAGIKLPEWLPLERLMNWRDLVEKYRAGLAAGGVVAAVLLVFVLLYVRHRSTVTERSASIFQQAFGMYSYQIPAPDSEVVPMVASEEEKYSRAMQAFQQLSDTYPGAKLAPVALIYTGNCRFRLKQFPQALESFDLFLARYPHHAMAAQAHLGRADCLAQLGRTQEALLSYSQAIKANTFVADEGRMGAVRCLIQIAEAEKNNSKMGEASALLNQMSSGSGYGASWSRSLRKLLGDLNTKAPK